MIQVNREAFERHLRFVNRTLAGGRWQNVILRSPERDVLEMQTANETSWSVTSMIGSGVIMSPVVLEHKSLLRASQLLTSDNLILDVDAERNHLHINGDVCVLYGVDIDTFVQLGISNDYNEVALLNEGQAFARAVKRCAFAIADSTRPPLAGIGVAIQGNMMTLLAADGTVAAMEELQLDQSFDQEVKIAIPEVNIGMFESLTQQSIYRIDKSEGRFFTGTSAHGSVCARLMDYHFPDALIKRALYPDTFVVTATISRKELANALGLVGLVADEDDTKHLSSQRIDLTFQDNAIVVRNYNTRRGSSNLTITAGIIGDARPTIALDAKRLTNHSHFTSCENLTIAVHDPQRAIIFLSDELPGYRNCLMPLMMR